MIFAHGLGCDQNMWRFVAPAIMANPDRHVANNKLILMRAKGHCPVSARRRRLSRQSAPLSDQGSNAAGALPAEDLEDL